MLQGKIFDNEKYINAISQLIDQAYSAMKFVYRLAEQAEPDAKVNIKNFGRRKDRFDSVLEELLEAEEKLKEIINEISLK